MKIFRFTVPEPNHKERKPSSLALPVYLNISLAGILVLIYLSSCFINSLSELTTSILLIGLFIIFPIVGFFQLVVSIAFLFQKKEQGLYYFMAFILIIPLWLLSASGTFKGCFKIVSNI